MSLKNSLKTSFLKFADVLPENIGFGLYHAIQKRLTGTVNSKMNANKGTYSKAQQLLKSYGGVVNKNILEIGSGWMPIMPFFFNQHGGAKDVFTFDINEHYDNVYIDELSSIFKRDYKYNLEIDSSCKYHLPEFVKYFPNANVIYSELPTNIDLIFSRFVLEHVTPNDIRAMHKKFFDEYDENTLILHFISPSDHRAYSDKSLSHYDFLKYSSSEWNRIQTKFDYHNRLRLPEYLELFDETGMEVLHLEYDSAEKGSEKYNKFKALNIHSDFASMSEKELTAGSINVLLRKKIK